MHRNPSNDPMQLHLEPPEVTAFPIGKFLNKQINQSSGIGPPDPATGRPVHPTEWRFADTVRGKIPCYTDKRLRTAKRLESRRDHEVVAAPAWQIGRRSICVTTYSGPAFRGRVEGATVHAKGTNVGSLLVRQNPGSIQLDLGCSAIPRACGESGYAQYRDSFSR
jgi:hypothetical protein